MTLIAYHASTSSQLENFDLSKSKKADYGVGIYLASTKQGTYGYGPNLYMVELDISNPYIIDNSPESIAIGKIIADKANVKSEHLDNDTHPFISACDLLNAIDAPSAISKAVVKAGYDGLIIAQEILNARGVKATADYIIAFSDKQILKIEKQKTGDNLRKEIQQAILQIVAEKPLEQRDLWNQLADQGLLNHSSVDHSFMLIEILNKLEKEGSIKKDNGLITLPQKR